MIYALNMNMTDCDSYVEKRLNLIYNGKCKLIDRRYDYAQKKTGSS